MKGSQMRCGLCLIPESPLDGDKLNHAAVEAFLEIYDHYHHDSISIVAIVNDTPSTCD